jgi:6-phosphogluconolactonase/glucosamine-6-phosphate isomerase/deaminase
MGAALLDRTIGQYRELARLNAEIEQAVSRGDHEGIDRLCRTMTELQESVRADDSRVLALLGQGDDGHEGRVLELLSLMQEIQERNQRLLPHLNAVLAVQQSERRALRRGNEVRQGYRQPVGQTGRRISSTN